MPPLLERLEYGLFFKSRTMTSPWGPILRLLRYPAAITRDWLAGDINVRAMSLAYTTLLSLVPLLVFSFSILKGLGARAHLRYILHEFFLPLGAAAAELTDNVMQFVTNMRGDVLGSLGLVFLVYTVVTTIQKVEASFNFVWRVERPRSFVRRFSEYLSVMIAGPIVFGVAIGLLVSVAHSSFAHWLHAVPAFASGLELLGRSMPYVLVAAVFTFMYLFVPNTRVNFRAAVVGGATAGVIWALVGKAFTALILYSSQLMAVYTGFAIVLTTLIWVYLSWLILLIGAQLAFYLQFPQYLLHGQQRVEITGSAREQVGLAVMYLIARDFTTGRNPWTGNHLAAELDIPSIALTPVLSCLEKRGLLVATEQERWLPARDPAVILLADVLDAVRTAQPGRLGIEVRSVAPVGLVVHGVDSAIRAQCGDRSLRDLIAAG